MTQKVLALTEDGKITYCTCPPELRGKGNCNHVLHQKEGQSSEEFISSVEYHREESMEEYEEEFLAREKAKIAWQGLHLDELYKDEDVLVRIAVAEQGAHLDELYKDKNWQVRVVVAEQGAHLDELYKDEHPDVRAAVAKRGAHLYELYKDENENVRLAAMNAKYSSK